MRHRHLLTAMLAMAFSVLTASADKAQDYRQFAEETKAWVYSLDLPAFDVREIPEKYKNESAVYIAVYDGMTVLRNTEPGRMPGTLRFARDKHIEGGDLQRMLVYIMISPLSSAFLNLISRQV